MQRPWFIVEEEWGVFWKGTKTFTMLSCTVEKPHKERWWEKPFVARQPLCYQQITLICLMCKLSGECWPGCWSSLGAEGRPDPSTSLGGKGFLTPSEVLVTGWVEGRLAFTAMGLWPCIILTVSGCAGSAVITYFIQPKLSYWKRQ